MPETDKALDATRGTAFWVINRLRSDLLPAPAKEFPESLGKVGEAVDRFYYGFKESGG